MEKELEWESPYDVVSDRYGMVWGVNESSDHIGRLDPKTGAWANYPLPRYTNLRRVFVDDRAPRVAVWPATTTPHQSSGWHP
jgi:virginiamycin B lyase